MSSRIKQTSIAVVAASLVALTSASTAIAAGKADLVDHPSEKVSANNERPQPAPNEQTGMSWIEYFQCVRVLQNQIGSWSYAAQECEQTRPDDPPDVPERNQSRDTDRRSDP